MSLDDLIEEVILLTSEEYEPCVFFMIRCLFLIESKCPEVGVLGIKIAKKYWIEKSISKPELDQARVNCWSYLDERQAITGAVDHEYCAVRAVICVLYPVLPLESTDELVSWFFNIFTSIFDDKTDYIPEVWEIIKELKNTWIKVQ